ncbi:hypothetical protein SAY86_007778 [Trapa natans]|uniref:Uncharacterized protein n=1 Tax=Trapa natans TaxID=22666 RepID=A0AAN7LFQ2_TRANT|nr:hypothetical protein SAY86_007778 [Trapa natans]
MARLPGPRMPSADRRQPLLKPHTPAAARLGEVAGGATAECVAVCCCCPCVVADLLVLAVYRLPAGLCRRALRKRRQRRMSKQIKGGGRCSCRCEENEARTRSMVRAEELLESKMKMEWSREMEELEAEMLKNFYNSGFWRSPLN